MEKENKKARDDARKEYNQTVRVSVRFLLLVTKFAEGPPRTWSCSYESVIQDTSRT